MLATGGGGEGGGGGSGEGDGGGSGGGGGDELSCVLDNCSSRRFAIRVKWRAELGMAPLEIRYTFGANPPPNLVRTLVVQMPAAGSKGTGWNDPLLYPPEEMEDGVVVSLTSTPTLILTLTLNQSLTLTPSLTLTHSAC